MGHVFASNLKDGLSFTSGASPSREFATVSPSVNAYATHIGSAKLTWQGMSSVASTFAYAGVNALVASITERCEPAEQPRTPIRSGSNPRSFAAARTSRTARCPSCQPDW